MGTVQLKKQYRFETIIMNFFFIPFFYFYHSRLRTLIKTVSWFFIYIIPIFILAFSNGIVSLNELAFLFLFIIGIYNLYEIGYINNDCETIKKENNPTLRLSKSEMHYYNKKKLLIYSVRVLISLIIGMLLSLNEKISIHYLVISYVGLLITFVLYNHIRSIANLPIHFLLVLFRFSSFSLVFNLGYECFMFSILIFPLINLIERSGEIRFKLTFFQKGIFLNRNLFRVLYYFILTLGLYFFNIYGGVLYTAIYMLSYRITSPLIFSIIKKS